MLDLVAALRCNGDKGEAVKWAKAYLGLDGADRAVLERQRRAAAAVQRNAAADREKDARRRRGLAFEIWTQSVHPIDGTPADTYLRGRGIALDALGYRPRSLRFHRELAHPETGELAPALVACIAGPDGRFAAVHRTFLQVRPDGTVGKLAGVRDAKMTLGGYAGGCIRLWRGHDRSAFGKAPPGSGIALVEGIEDGLTLALANPARRVAVTVSLSNLGGIVLPAAYQHVAICADNDASGSQAEAALARAVERLRRQGRVVEIKRPPAGFKDFNAMLAGPAPAPAPAAADEGAA